MASAGNGISMSPARMIVCIDLIMPQSCCMDADIKNEIMKLAADTELNIKFVLSVEARII